MFANVDWHALQGRCLRWQATIEVRPAVTDSLMPSLSRIEIRSRLSAFAKEWQDAHSEAADAKTFWLRFYKCYGIRAESATRLHQANPGIDVAPRFLLTAARATSRRPDSIRD
ncbi:hypothetical protein THIX_60966 [Thiomonas sp. X19]|uniref:hypothetical protein n=1 Tax=Thiomonas sp. X19 TaxID=1050370 RepID=UPI000B638157|nr:hypothetical protein [Thiomonas sp. X19]SCC94908.1 hypothetical protein THIX_60966 [Thiomonas sp. X19]